jgi:hypothetical protein
MRTFYVRFKIKKTTNIFSKVHKLISLPFTNVIFIKKPFIFKSTGKQILRRKAASNYKCDLSSKYDLILQIVEGSSQK